MLRKSRFKNRRKSNSAVNDQIDKYTNTFWERDVELESRIKEQMCVAREWNIEIIIGS